MDLKALVLKAEKAICQSNLVGAMGELVTARDEGVRVGLATGDPHLWVRIHILLAIACLQPNHRDNFESYRNIANILFKKIRFPSAADDCAVNLLNIISESLLGKKSVGDRMAFGAKFSHPSFQKLMVPWLIPVLQEVKSVLPEERYGPCAITIQKAIVRATGDQAAENRKIELEKLIELQFKHGERDNSGDFLLQLLDILYRDVSKPSLEIAKTHRRLAWVLLANGSVAKASLHMDKALIALESIEGANGLRARILCDKAVMSSNRGLSNEECLVLIDNAIAAAEQSTKQDVVLLSRIWNVKADFLIRKGNKIGGTEAKEKSAYFITQNVQPEKISTQKAALVVGKSRQDVTPLTASDFAANSTYYKPPPEVSPSSIKTEEPVADKKNVSPHTAAPLTEKSKIVTIIPKTAAGIANSSGNPTYSQQSVDTCMVAINALTGLKQAKLTIKKLIDFYRFQQIRALAGHICQIPPAPHMFFLGNPGTGKTTLARLMGQLFFSLGVTESPEVIEVSRADLVGQFIGQTAQRTTEIIKRAKGKTLFIDEIYSLSGDSLRDFGKEAVDTLVQAMTDPVNNMIVIGAGYAKKIEQLLTLNPGLASRIVHHVALDDYIPEELIQIADSVIEQRGMTISKPARQLLIKKITELYRSRDETFGNGRLVGNIVSKIEQALSSRIIEDTAQENMNSDFQLEVLEEDVETGLAEEPSLIPEFAVDEELLSQSLQELDGLVGMKQVKEELQEIISLARYYKEEHKNVLEAFSLNLAFLGAPGTGKTTVARILSEAFKVLGILERGHLVECDRSSLVTGRGNGSSEKMMEMFHSALGGTLFIDEVYALINGSNDAWGFDAVNTLVKLIEDNRGKLCVIIAGYSKETEEFLKYNSGMKSRFDKFINFPDYSIEELSTIAKRGFEKNSLEIEPSGLNCMLEYFKELISQDANGFGNARGVRKVVEDAVRKQQVRLSKIPCGERTNQMKSSVTLGDIEVTLEKLRCDSGARKKKIGY